VLEGEGQFLYREGQPLPFDAGKVLYCPPNTTHNMKNTGSTPLKYIYVVAQALFDQEDG
jgi:mannose-6-phosphate isomerase-like protein (cupin superfamily)